MSNLIKDFTKLVVPTVASKTRNDISLNSNKFVLSDNVLIATEEETNINTDAPKVYTDFAFFTCENSMEPEHYSPSKNQMADVWLRTPLRANVLQAISHHGRLDYDYITERRLGVCPILTLDLSNLKKEDLKQILGTIKSENSGNKKEYFMQIGEYPNSFVNKQKQEELEKLFNGGNLLGGLACTGRLFTYNGKMPEHLNFLTAKVPEFEYMGEKYVRAVGRINIDDRTNKTREESYVKWIKVEPITFKIQNPIKLKDGKSLTLKLQSKEAIISGLPYFPSYEHAHGELWQNSLIRAFLNSCQLSNLNKNKSCDEPLDWDFTNSGFLYEALCCDRAPTSEFTINYSEHCLCPNAFNGCVGLKKIIIPNHVKQITLSAFDNLPNTILAFTNCNRIYPDELKPLVHTLITKKGYKMYISKGGEDVIFSPNEDKALNSSHIQISNCSEKKFCLFMNQNYRKNYINLTNLKQQNQIKFIPLDYTLECFPHNCIQDYFANKNNHKWARLIKFAGFDLLSEDKKENALADLLKIYYALGGFSTNQSQSDIAYNYMVEHVLGDRVHELNTSLLAEYLHNHFADIKLKDRFNPTFAKFFMKYYKNNDNFMHFNLSPVGVTTTDYLCMAHNSFDKILKAFPYKTVSGNSHRSTLTPKFVAEHSFAIEYTGVKKGNEALAEIISLYGYSQEGFDQIQYIYEKAKKISNSYVIKADKAKNKDGISFRILDKLDPLGFVLGNITNCCQAVGDRGERCVDDGYSNPDAGFLVFEESLKDSNGNYTGEKRIIGQAYIWYDPKTKTVCYDNIEVPLEITRELTVCGITETGLTVEKFLDVIEESALAIITAMNQNKVMVKRVTTGEGFNDLKQFLKERFKITETHPSAVHRNYEGYTDAANRQILIKTYKGKTNSLRRKIGYKISNLTSKIKEFKELIKLLIDDRSNYDR